MRSAAGITWTLADLVEVPGRICSLDLTLDVQESLLATRDAGVLEALAAHRGLALGVQEELVDVAWDFPGVESMLASNPVTAASVLVDLVESEVFSVAGVVALNPGATGEVLLAVVRSDQVYARLCLATRPGLPLEFQEMLAEDEEETVRLALAKNPHLYPSLAECVVSNIKGWRQVFELAEAKGASVVAQVALANRCLSQIDVVPLTVMSKSMLVSSGPREAIEVVRLLAEKPLLARRSASASEYVPGL